MFFACRGGGRGRGGKKPKPKWKRAPNSALERAAGELYASDIAPGTRYSHPFIAGLTRRKHGLSSFDARTAVLVLVVYSIPGGFQLLTLHLHALVHSALVNYLFFLA